MTREQKPTSQNADPNPETVPPGEVGVAKTRPSKPTRPLPTDRIRPQKQFDLCRAWVAAARTPGQSASNEDVAAISDMVGTTISLANSFFVDIGFLSKGNDGNLIPSEAVFDYARQHDWDPKKAPYKLAPPLIVSWAGEALIPRIKYSPITETEGITLLADAVSAEKGPYDRKFKVLLEFLETTGIVLREDGLLKPGPALDQSVTVSKEQEDSQKAQKAQKEPMVEPKQAGPVVDEASRKGLQSAIKPTQEGAVQYHFSIRVSMEEMSSWSEERIKAFFNGLAQVLSASRSGES